jgi:hypothetical protein
MKKCNYEVFLFAMYRLETYMTMGEKLKPIPNSTLFWPSILTLIKSKFWEIECTYNK